MAAYAGSLGAQDVDDSARQRDAARVIVANGQVSTEKKGQTWALGDAERIAVTKPIRTGPAGYGRFEVAGGTTFDVFGSTILTFRPNVGNPQDLLDILTGRVTVQLKMSPEQPVVYRVQTPVAIITAHGDAAFTLAVDDEDDATRIDVQTGEVSVQHALLPRDLPVVVKAGDAIAVQRDSPLISRRLDRGSLYRYTFGVLFGHLGSVIPGHSPRNIVSEDVPDANMLARNR